MSAKHPCFGPSTDELDKAVERPIPISRLSSQIRYASTNTPLWVHSGVKSNDFATLLFV